MAISMSTPEMAIPAAAVEAVARTLYKEAHQYGFRQTDYLRLVNHLLGMSMRSPDGERQRTSDASPAPPTTPLRMPLEGRDVRVREFEAATDRALFEKWIHDRGGRYFLLSSITAKTLEIDQVLASENNILGTITLADTTPIGIMAFLDYDRYQRKAELRKLIGDLEYRGRGFAKQATEVWIRYGLSSLGLQKIYLNTLDTNVRNIRLNEELGFQVEGILRKEFYFDGAYHDALRMALLRD